MIHPICSFCGDPARPDQRTCLKCHREYARNWRRKVLREKLARRDQCLLVGRRAGRLSPGEAATAWARLAEGLEAMGDLDIPKFVDILTAVRAATIRAKIPKLCEPFL